MQRLRELSSQVVVVLNELSDIFSTYQQRQQLHCLDSCGACCNKPDIEVTALEMLPLALHMFDQGTAEAELDSLEEASGFACKYYQRQSLDGQKGRCTVYHQRPGLCRMFGVAGYKSKSDMPTLSVCGLIKQAVPEKYAASLISLGNHKPPMIAEGQARLAQLDYTLGTTMLPINEALKLALNKVLTEAYYSGSFDEPIVAA
ncbi:YkgJ family cysteine cluster protein [Salinimonas lutimaris]|uniref:YkgJ family cysteine cluster protein n=1 Tax=Salinimonas lutimaris TaxID=914153 RepID=UPI0010C07D92|nr:YkgJ family cysteine cluster protein [Salinimonas lutimaris]